MQLMVANASTWFWKSPGQRSLISKSERQGNEFCWESTTEVQPQMVQFLWSREWCRPNTRYVTMFTGAEPNQLSSPEEERRAEIERQKRREDEVPWSLMNQSPASKHFILFVSYPTWKVVGRLTKEWMLSLEMSWDYIYCWTFDTKNGCSDPQRQNVPYQTKDQNFFGDDSNRIHFWSPLLISQVSVVDFLIHLKSTHHSEAHGPICELISFCLLSHPSEQTQVS